MVLPFFCCSSCVCVTVIRWFSAINFYLLSSSTNDDTIPYQKRNYFVGILYEMYNYFFFCCLLLFPHAMRYRCHKRAEKNTLYCQCLCICAYSWPNQLNDMKENSCLSLYSWTVCECVTFWLNSTNFFDFDTYDILTKKSFFGWHTKIFCSCCLLSFFFCSESQSEQNKQSVENVELLKWECWTRNSIFWFDLI